jgi:hypothetical protein
VNNELERIEMKLLNNEFRHHPSIYWEGLRGIVKT